MKHLSMLAAFALCGVLAAACASASNGASEAHSKGPTFSGPMEDRLTLEYRACATDTDCVLAQNGCCDCANGGEDIAIHRDHVEAFKARFQCGGGCTEIGGDCGRGAISCENKLCTYREPAR
jgi:hypothetical protein